MYCNGLFGFILWLPPLPLGVEVSKNDPEDSTLDTQGGLGG
jgi:hypothetical protein